MEKTFEWENRTRLVHDVADVLRKRIYSGQIRSGEPLRQEQVASELRISRTPLREALRMLEREGLVHAGPGGRVTVTQVDFSELLEAYAMREVIDGLAASLASQRAVASDIAMLGKIIERQEVSLHPWIPNDYTQTNVEFHVAITSLANNPFLSRQLPIIHMTSRVFTPQGLLQRDRAVSAIQEHIEIINAIASQDAFRAEETARRHIRNTINRLREAASNAVPE
ncbi:MAG: GntR family transcriptional regulator [Pusillimonas sp.]